MRVPTRVVFLGRPIQIKYLDRILDGSEEIFAISYTEDSRIEISTSRPESEQAVWDTLLHELMHVLLGRSGLSEIIGEALEEAICYASEGLGPLLTIREDTPGSKWANVSFDWEGAG